MRYLALIGCLGVLAGLTGCPVKGTDEALEFKLAPTFSHVDYTTLRQQVLGPFGCIRCHAKMGTETGLQKYLKPGSSADSELYQRVVATGSDSMPKGGPHLSSGFIKIVQTYIDELKPTTVPVPPPSHPNPPSPPTTNPPSPPNGSLPEPTYASLRAKVLEVSCKGCHGMSGKPAGRRKDFSKYDVVKDPDLANEMYRRMTLPDSDEDVMPPPEADNRQRVSDDQAKVFSDWISKGFPEN